MFDPSPANQELPNPVPRTAAPEALPVTAHLVWADGHEEWAPAVATRWTSTHVLVEIPARATLICWLSAEDVRRAAPSG